MGRGVLAAAAPDICPKRGGVVCSPDRARADERVSDVLSIPGRGGDGDRLARGARRGPGPAWAGGPEGGPDPGGYPERWRPPLRRAAEGRRGSHRGGAR